MFAFGLWDDDDAKLFLVRDRLGVKPLAYFEKDGIIAFASTPAALEAARFVRALDDQAVAEFLEFGFVPERSSIFKDVRKLPPATILEWTAVRSSTRSYWSVPARPNGRSRKFEDVVDEAEDQLLQAVSIRQFADVPVAALLSGGIDSALVCWALAKVGADVAAYTVGTPGDASDETPDAAATAAALGMEHRIIPMDEGSTPQVADLVETYPEPFACASALGMLALAKTIRPHATVVLTGDGGDDAFLGYGRHRYLWLAQRCARRIPAPILSAWGSLSPLASRTGMGRKGTQFMNVVAGGLGAYMSNRRGIPDFAADGWLGDRLIGTRIPERELPQTAAAARSALPRFLDLHRTEKLVAEYLTKVDGATMHHALEARSPFLDQHVWEFAAGVPLEIHLRGGRLKAILRALSQRHLGERVASGKKRGFVIPVERWLTGRWGRSLQESLHDSVLEREGYVRTEPLLSQLNSRAPGQPLPTHFWYYLVLETWMRQVWTRGAPRTAHLAVADRVP
jgi:asparagine synthase (glutamine-hydrolysing)